MGHLELVTVLLIQSDMINLEEYMHTHNIKHTYNTTDSGEHLQTIVTQTIYTVNIITQLKTHLAVYKVYNIYNDRLINCYCQ